MKHVVPAQPPLLWTVMELTIQVSITLLSQQVAAKIQIIVVLQKALGHNWFWDLWKTLLEILQDVIVELRTSLRHPEPTRRVNEPEAAKAEIPDLVSSPYVKNLSRVFGAWLSPCQELPNAEIIRKGWPILCIH